MFFHLTQEKTKIEIKSSFFLRIFQRSFLSVTSKNKKVEPVHTAKGMCLNGTDEEKNNYET